MGLGPIQATSLVGRSRKEAFLTIGGIWLAFTFALCLALPQPPNPRHVLLGTLAGLIVVGIGYWAALRCRPLLPRTTPQRANLALLSLLAGITLGTTLLGVLLALAKIAPFLHARFAGRLAEPFWRPWALALESSILEEVAFRLFVMSIVACIVARCIKRPGVSFVMALVFSSLLFGVAHLPAWLSMVHSSVTLIGSVLLLNGLGGSFFGWIFWRWGLGYAILCHLVSDLVIQVFAPRLLG